MKECIWIVVLAVLVGLLAALCTEVCEREKLEAKVNELEKRVIVVETKVKMYTGIA